jgi:hypothetical protein
MTAMGFSGSWRQARMAPLLTPVTVVLLCLGASLPLLATTGSEGAYSSTLAMASRVPPQLDQNVLRSGASLEGSYFVLPPYAEEAQQTDKRPVNASHLMVLVLAIASFGSSVLWVLAANARRRGAICSSGVVRGSFASASLRKLGVPIVLCCLGP